MMVSGRRVRVEFDADVALLPMVRAVAANLAMVEDFTIDDISDVRLAVDEMCTTLITHATRGSLLDCRLDTVAGQMAVSGTVDAVRDQDTLEHGHGQASHPSRDTMSWEIMSVLADTVTSEVHEGPVGTARLTMSLTKRRGEG
jgi:serine/threonine-protein kinase RsbW